ncbi:Thioredoxin family protein [Histomonas meleagridis]|uniref:Thioredoxin family protein n=1 Tax=Histomonas meleagridis TaxID=135588 RepID=UPI003559E195|nr:Thioredoxin family protein [Histomonas meleagridis]KAH0803618.1 Thioredoxin family protein [Histomonas meleagridis]
MLSTLLCCCSAYKFGKNVIQLTANNFPKEVEKRDNKTVYFVMFHGTHCPACQMSYPEFDAAATEAAGMIKFGEVNTNQQYSLGSQFRITAIPTFIIFHPKGQMTYMRDRSARSMLNTASRLIPNLAETVDEEWIPQNDTREVILFTDKPKAPPLWAGISCAFSDNNQSIRIGFSNNRTIHQKFNITSTPAILMINGDKQILYEGRNKYDLIKKTVKDFFNGIMPSPKPTPKPTPVPVLIHNLTNIDEFNSHCKGKRIFCVIEGSDVPSEEFKSASKKYRHDPFMFYECGENCPLDFINDNIWILHHKRDAAIKVTDKSTIGSFLDRVLDGGAKFELLERLFKQPAPEL